MNVTAIFAYATFFGAEKANVEVFRLLKKAGHDLLLITRHDIPEGLQDHVSKQGLKNHNVVWGPDYLGFKNSILEYLKALYRMITVPVELLQLDRERKTDVVYVPNYIQFFFVWLYLLLTNKKTVFRIGDIPSTGWAHFLMWNYFINPRVALYVCNSECARFRLLKIIGAKHEKKVQVIRNIYNMPIERVAKSLAHTVVPECLFVGQLNLEKGAHIAIEAAIRLCKENENIIFSFVGQDRSEDELIKNLIEDISRDENLSSRIHFYGYVTHDKVKSHYSKAHVLMVPSMFEDSSPNVVIEGRYLGLPVVAFPAGGISELVVHKKTGYLCNESSVEALIEGIYSIISSPKVYKDLSEKSLDISPEFQPKFIQQAWSSIFEPSNY